MAGILGSVLGESPESQKERLELATKQAKDLSGLIKKKKPTSDGSSMSASAIASLPPTNGKRKADELGVGKDSEQEEAAKRQHT